ncbi:molybdenum cofactor guanylyltransferase MobA [Acidiphilium sp.]|uniref:molybdenum cofactor guanylyltransferase MobA n=1 Tax=Acidiphilium sp. TaxID=527 RepID=UPI002585CDE9|nr:molybdenum cofactor guanylyltransferase MobA [Acidiphilium sp.]
MADPSGSHLRAVILAGGAGRRLGGVDKALLILHGRTMLDHAIATVSGQVGAVALSAAGDPARFARFGIPVLEDGRHRGKGPLAGVLAGMRWAAETGGEALLSLPVDTPFAPRDLVARLGAAPSVAASHGRTHHLVALWPVAAADALERFLDGPGPYRVSGFAAEIGMRAVAFADERDPFVNINTQADLDAAEAGRC